MDKPLQSKLLSQFPEINQGTYVYGPPFKVNVKFNINQNKLFKSLGLTGKDSLFIGLQEHTDNVFVVKNKTKIGELKMIPNTDALATNQKSVYLAVYTADCLPVFIYDPIEKVIAIAHAGWKGVLNKIVIKAIEKMEKEFGSNRKDVLISVGPS
ncbi:MAG: polyphenol oxidase family protein, partial [Patescibacteria group bacterium]|nr:polyphenol oxidase family protein [Patescibacteria group bacterium]